MELKCNQSLLMCLTTFPEKKSLTNKGTKILLGNKREHKGQKRCQFYYLS